MVSECLFAPKGRRAGRRVEVGRRDGRFWPIAAFLLDLLDACDGRLAPAAARMDVSTANLVDVLQSERHLLAAAQDIRKAHGQKPLH